MRVPLLKFEGGPVVPLLNFEEGLGVPLLNFEGFPGPESKGPEVLGPGVLVPLLHHAKNNRFCFHGHDLIKTSKEPTGIHHRKNSEKAIQWYSFKYNHALKSHPIIKGIL